jgi:hypothetical protein
MYASLIIEKCRTIIETIKIIKMKTKRLVTILAVTGLAFIYTSCSETLEKVEDSIVISESEKSAESVIEAGDSCTFTGTLTEAEIEGLMEMREEEKLARDVYLKFYEIHGHIVFKNIAKSENAHTSAVLYLINGFGLEDLALPDEGEFSNPVFANLYTQLIEQGTESLVEALKVAAFIEEYDIADLLQFLEENENEDVERVYTNLLRGSENHMRAFTNALSRLGETYTPTIISVELYQGILDKTNNFSENTGNTTSPFSRYTFTDELTEFEIEGLMEMREEEKLAQDFYLYFYNLYEHPVFRNISKSEAAHTKAVLWLINGYGLEDPYLEGIGNFTNPLFTELYTQLTEKGSESLVEALKVGAFIEEYDINDLLHLLEQTESDNIYRVYENLLRGSEFHIKAFTNVLKLYDEVYTPTILSEELYQEIINK